LILKTKFLILFAFLIVGRALAQVQQVQYWPIAPQTSPPALFHMDGDYDGDDPNTGAIIGHDGVDIPELVGTSVFAVADGTVSIVGTGQGDFIVVADSYNPAMGWCYAHIVADGSVAQEGRRNCWPTDRNRWKLFYKSTRTSATNRSSAFCS
jgi:hypothetical protein